MCELVTDDGSAGKKGLVTDALEALIKAGNVYDEVIAIGPLVMMKFVCKLTEKYGIKTVVSMNPIMIDGTGMCGGCRLTVGGEMKFACVDGTKWTSTRLSSAGACTPSSRSTLTKKTVICLAKGTTRNEHVKRKKRHARSGPASAR